MGLFRFFERIAVPIYQQVISGGLHGLLHIKRRVGVGVAMLVVVGRYRRDGCRQQTVFARRSVDARQGLLLAGRGLSATVSIYTIVFQVDQRKRSWVGNFPADHRRQRAPAGRAIQKQLAESGVRELILVAQDVTRYGADLYNSPKLTELLRSLSEIEQIRRIRLLYCYPEEIDEALIKEIASNPKIVKYLDIPLQHVHNDILKSMNRRSSFEEICELFKYLRTEIPDISIRSTFICGFPGEQTKHFLTLKSFIEKQKLENVGFFAYSPEEGTVAALMKERISEKVTQHRLQKLAKCQQKVVRILNKRHVGKVYEVLIDDFCELDSKKNLLIYKGRTYFQTPEVDGVVYIESENELVIGEFYDVAITDFKDYDLRGEVAK